VGQVKILEISSPKWSISTQNTTIYAEKNDHGIGFQENGQNVLAESS
jgi:hypothetical protein